MELFQDTVDRLASPWILYSAALVGIFFASRSRWLSSRWGGVVLVLLTAAVLGAGLGDHRCRGLLLDPVRLPALVWSLLSLAFLWWALHRGPNAVSGPPRNSADRAAGDWAVFVVAGLVLLVAALLLEPPLGASALDLAAEAVPATAATAPWFLSGLQEMRFYFEPWMANLGLPVLFFAALLALPYLDTADPAAADATGERRRLLTFAAAVILLVLLPILVATFLRGPQWNAFGPFEVRDPARPPPPPAVPLSLAFWCRWLGMSAPPSPWPLRELPGALLLIAYFGLLPWTLARWRATRRSFGRYRKAVGRWRYRLALAVALALALVPLKMYGRWLLDVGHWLSLPELSFHF